MAVKIYTCDHCGFLFSRAGECDQCPDCGKKAIRFANPDEIKEFEFRQKHPEDCDYH